MSFIQKIGRELIKTYKKIIEKLKQLKGTPQEIAKGFATGVAVSFTPFVGFHLLICLIIAKIFKQNSMSAFLGTIAGNPWTFPFIWYATLKTGRLMLRHTILNTQIDFKKLFSNSFHALINLDFDTFISDIWPIYYPMLIGCIPFCLIVWIGTYSTVIWVLNKKTLRKGEK